VTKFVLVLVQISLNAVYDWWNLACGANACGSRLDPATLWWKHDQLFLLGAFIFEDLAVTAYQARVGPGTLTLTFTLALSRIFQGKPSTRVPLARAPGNAQPPRSGRGRGL